jgi:hypothetical protein
MLAQPSRKEPALATTASARDAVSDNACVNPSTFLTTTGADGAIPAGDAYRSRPPGWRCGHSLWQHNNPDA